MLTVDTGLATPPPSRGLPHTPTCGQSFSQPSARAPLPDVYKAWGIDVIDSPLMPGTLKVKQQPFSWTQVQEIVATNDLDLFARLAPGTDEYLAFKAQLKRQGTTIQDYLVRHELEWADVQIPDHKLFTVKDDIKVMYNKFPYYFEDNVTHLCVWTKVPIPNDPNSATGDISAYTRAVIDTFVRKLFPNSQLVWFRNWAALQLVRAISHCHVIIKDVDPKLLARALAGDFDVLTEADYKAIDAQFATTS